MRRGQTNYNFLIGVDKSTGITSHDVVGVCRKSFGEGRIGHMGTLDPLASGIMVLGVGSAARLNKYLENHDKKYIADIVFGEDRNTYDAEGEVLSKRPVPAYIDDVDYCKEIINSFIGRQTQKPPIFSAIKINGKAAYKYARRGEGIEIPSREVEIYDVDLLNYDKSHWEISVFVSKGTYIRSIAHDIGEKVGCGAYLRNLRRTQLGEVCIEQCNTIDFIKNNEDISDIKKLNPVQLLGYKAIEANEYIKNLVQNGSKIPVNDKNIYALNEYVSIIEENRLLAIYCFNGKELKADCVFSGPITW